MKHLRLIIPVLVLGATLAATTAVGRSQPAPTAPARGDFDSLRFRPLGPASMSGRISDVAVFEANPALFYVGTAHGGVWKTTNNGTTFEAQLQDRGLMSVGDVAVSQTNPDLVWAGMGESNNRQSTSWGDGVYKSSDGGKTWTHMGLKTSRHINRVVIDPRDNDIVFVAATGALWGSGGERGVYKTADGGSTWKQVLKVDDDTGANDLVMDSTDNRVLYASMYQRRRTACCMNGGGSGSGIWKSTDAGETWARIKGGVLDQPLGRIALDIYRRRSNILYALIEGPAQAGAGRGAGNAEAGPGATPAGAPGAAQAGAPGGAPAGPQGGAPGGGRGQQPLNPNDPTGLYRSDDAGATWRKVNNANPRPMYFSQVRIDPNDPEIVYLGGVGLHQTLDGGKTIATDVAVSTHDDVHAIWIDPMNSDHVIIGNDGGLAYSYDKAKKWVFVPNLPVGLFYHVSYDMAMPYNVCGGMQDNYNWCGPSAVRGAAGIANHHWATLQGGDGFVVLQDPTDYRIAFSESQDGNIVRVDRVTGETMSVRPQPGPGEPALRWHWDTPLMLSPHDPKVLFAAANKVFRSSDRGLSWTAVSGDLTDGQNRDEIVTMGLKGSEIRISRNDGISQWPAIVSFAESPKRAGLYYAGTDDGNLQVSRDAGRTWTKVFEKLQGAPKGIFISEVVPSRFDEATVYVTLDGHRQNDYDTYIYVSNDYGQTFRSLNGNLAGEVARTLTEDIRNADVLYLGTETGLFVTTDRGRGWQRIKANLPTVRIDEITLHPRDNAMLLATHGRAIWILDHLEPIQEYTKAQQTTADAALFTPPPFAWYQRPARDRNYEFWGDQTFFGENPPQAAVVSWTNKEAVGDVKLRITDAAGREVREISGPVLNNSKGAGLQAACWDLRVQPVPTASVVLQPGGRQGGGRQGGGAQPEQRENTYGAGCASAGGGGGSGGTPGPYVLPGVYNVSLIVDGKTIDTKPMRVMADKAVALTEAERKRLHDMSMELHALQRRAHDVIEVIVPVQRQMAEVMKQVAAKSDLPTDVKAQAEAVDKELTALVTKLVPPGGGRGGRGGGGEAGTPSLMARAAQAKNGLMAGMGPTQATMTAYSDAKTGVPAAITEANAMTSKLQALSAALAKHGITLTVASPPKSGTDGAR